MSMSANILSNLVSSVFNVKATSVVLSGEISPDYFALSHDNTQNDFSTTLFGFTPTKGFVRIEEVETIVNYDDCSSTGGQKRLFQLLPLPYIFYVEVYEEGDGQKVKIFSPCMYQDLGDFTFSCISEAGDFYNKYLKASPEAWQSCNMSSLGKKDMIATVKKAMFSPDGKGGINYHYTGGSGSLGTLCFYGGWDVRGVEKPLIHRYE